MVKGIGIVISGTLKTGEIRINDKMSLGPVEGKFIDVKLNLFIIISEKIYLC